MKSVRELFRRVGRKLIYGTRIGRLLDRLRRAGGGTPEHGTATYWDRELRGPLGSYLGNNFAVDLRNVLVAKLVRHAGLVPRSVLDVGCGSGTLAKAFAPALPELYVGVDISAYAIETADAAIGEFHAANLCEWSPKEGQRFDAIVFQEVLYYLSLEQADLELARYARWLTPDGVLVISLKDDPKSHAIFDRVHENFAWITGVLSQEQTHEPAFRVRFDRKIPAHLIGVVRPRRG